MLKVLLNNGRISNVSKEMETIKKSKGMLEISYICYEKLTVLQWAHSRHSHHHF